MNLTKADEAELKQVHPDLVKVIRRAAVISIQAFKVIDGARTMKEQVKNVAGGKSQTMHSRHIPGNNKSGFACAVDLACLVKGRIDWHYPLYTTLARYVKQAAGDVGVPIEWGGDWTTLKDGTHFQLPWKQYP